MLHYNTISPFPVNCLRLMESVECSGIRVWAVRFGSKFLVAAGALVWKLACGLQGLASRGQSLELGVKGSRESNGR